MFTSGCAGTQHITTSLTVPNAVPQLLAPLLPATFVVLGKLHDVDGHQQLQVRVIEHLTAQQQLHAVVLEMAYRGHSTQDLRQRMAPKRGAAN